MRRPISLIICLLVPIVVLLIGLTWAGAYAYYEFPKLNVEDGRGVLPPGFDVKLKDPHQYSIRLHTVAEFDGRVYENSGDLAEGAQVVVIDKSSGNKLDIGSILIGPKKVLGQDAVVIGTFEIFREKELEIRGTGFGDGAVVSIAKSNDEKKLRTMMSFISIVILTLFVAIMTLIILLHRRAKVIAAER